MKRKKITLSDALFTLVVSVVLFSFLIAGLQNVFLSPQLSPSAAAAGPLAGMGSFLVFIGIAFMFMVIMGYVVFFILVNRRD